MIIQILVALYAIVGTCLFGMSFLLGARDPRLTRTDVVVVAFALLTCWLPITLAILARHAVRRYCR